MSIRPDEPRVWNERVRERGGSFLQSSEWGDFQERRGRTVVRITLKNGQALVILYRLPGGFSYAYLPHGPVVAMATKEILDEMVQAITAATLETCPIFIRVEPLVGNTENVSRALRTAKFHRTADAQPSETRILDLTRTERDILAGMKHDTRYAIRTAEKRGVRVRVITERAERVREFESFWKIFSETAQRHELANYPESYYRDVIGLEGECPATLFLAEREGMCIGGAISVIFGTQVVYFYAASAFGYGKFNAPSAILWEVIREAKRRGARTLDLWGESDSKPKWRGITAFKRSFGGTTVRYVGTWDLPLRPFWYRAYRLVTKFLHH